MNNINPLIAIGLGIGIGVCGLWMLIEMWPLIILGGAGYLILKGVEKNIKENTV